MQRIKPTKKIPLLCFFLLCTASLSFSQIYRGEAETKTGAVSFSLHYVDYTGYRSLLHIDGVSIFLDEDNIIQLETILEKFISWEEMAEAEQINLTKTIDSITFTSFNYSHTFFKEPLIFYFVFTGGSLQSPEDFAEAAGNHGDPENTDTSGETPPTRYTLYIDTTLDRIAPFRLTSKTIKEMHLALSPEKLTESWDAYERQRALEEMFQ